MVAPDGGNSVPGGKVGIWLTVGGSTGISVVGRDIGMPAPPGTDCTVAALGEAPGAAPRGGAAVFGAPEGAGGTPAPATLPPLPGACGSELVLSAAEGTPGATDCAGERVVTGSPRDASGRVAILDGVPLGAAIVENATNCRLF